ncbi:MAG TPA: amidohydrolase family protein [Egibacteraceae bacterium]|nr:amidohydrolase family protein [Egibacteraceae bacterium]
MPPILYSADVVCPMSGPPLAQGGVLVDGDRVAAVGPSASLRGDAAREHRIPGVLLPGMVNAHSHLEYADAAELARPCPFVQWVLDLGRLVQGWDADRWSRSAHRGAQATLRGGATAVCDIVTKGPAVPAAGTLGLGGLSWVELAFVDWEHHDDVLAKLRAALELPAHGRVVGLAPHAPYSVGTGVLQAVAALARERGVPLHTHAAETREEVEALRQGTGPLAQLARGRGMDFEWLDGGTGLSPVRYLDACGALFPGASVAHGVWVDGEEAALLAERGAAVVLCPRSNALLSAGDAPLERYAEAGTALALGTDSAASCPDLDVLGEAHAWVELARRRGLDAWPADGGPRELAEQAIRLATVDGAAAMGLGAAAGVIEPGRRADLVGVAVDTTVEDVWRDLVAHGPGQAVCTVVAGVRKARREPGTPWPEIDRQEWRA